MKKKKKKMINDGIKKYMPLAITLIFFSSMLIGFDRDNGEGKPQQKTRGITAFFVLNISGQEPSGGQIIVNDNSSIIDFFDLYKFNMRLDKRSDGTVAVVCMSNLCNSLDGKKWRVYLNGNESNFSIEDYKIEYGDVIELRYY